MMVFIFALAFAVIAAFAAYIIIAVGICLVTLAFRRAHISPFIGWGVLFAAVVIATLFRH